MLHRLMRWVTVLALLLGGAGPAFARQQAPAMGAAAQAHYDIPGDIRSLQSLLAVLGYYHQDPTGQWDDATAGALQAFQAAQGLPVTAELDALTLDALGGSAERMDDRPRFHYVPGEGESLADIADRFGSTLPWIARYNPAIQSLDQTPANTEIVVPIRFPLPGDLRADRTDVLPGRFLGTYASDVPFANVGQLAEHLAGLLQESGFEVEPAATPLDGITLRGNGVVLGRVVFSASPADGKTRLHLALLFLQHEALEQDIEAGAWIRSKGDENGDGDGGSQ